MARVTGLEPATPGVTGRYSNQLSYTRALGHRRSGERVIYTRTISRSSRNCHDFDISCSYSAAIQEIKAILLP